MAGNGRPPSEDSIRRKDHKDIIEKTTVGKKPKLRGEPLPAGIEWHARTIAWWENWRRSPLAENFGTTDWDFLLETAFLHTQFWNGSHSLAAELRLRVSKMGATPEDRLRLRLEITNPENESAEETTTTSSTKKSIKKTDRRARLTELKIVPPLVS